MKFLLIVVIAFAGLFLLSCGQKGPLYLPDASSSNNASIIKE